MPSVWAMQCKRDLTTNIVKGYMPPYYQHSKGSHATIKLAQKKTCIWHELLRDLCTCCDIIFGIEFFWALRQVDFVMAYSHTPIKNDIYMELPQGIETTSNDSHHHVLKLLRNIYGQKQAG